MKISMGTVAVTTFIDFDDVLVPVKNLNGTEGHGLKSRLTNFNRERLSLSISAIS